MDYVEGLGEDGSAQLLEAWPEIRGRLIAAKARLAH